MKIALIFGSILISMAASAENWINISAEGENPYYFDKDSISSRYDPKGDLLVSMWTMYPSEYPIMEGTVANQMLNYANCSDMSLKHAEMLELKWRWRNPMEIISDEKQSRFIICNALRLLLS